MASLMQLSFLHHIVIFLLMMPIIPTESARSLTRRTVIITNNHTKILTVRCFTFFDENSTRTRRMHLKPMESYNFSVQPNGFFPSATMYNCSTNMGVFVAYKNDYNCSVSPDPARPCEWMFDQDQTYHKSDSGDWEAVDYNPNYESHGRGGVVRGYFTN